MVSSSKADFKPEPKFPWTRYWHVTPAVETSQSSNDDRFIDEDSFLHLPEDLLPGLNSRHEAGLFTLPELLSSPALILLGRPGAGKSTEIEMASLSQPGVRLIQHRAKDYEGNASTLLDKLETQASKGQPVRLVMDGTDELLLENAKFLNSLEAGLEQRRQSQGLTGIQLILSCRAAEWPEGKLAHLWPNQLKVARLCQLDHTSARNFVTAHLGERSDAFWDAVHSLRIGFLTIWPHSLSSLVESFFKNDGKLPGTLFELVQQTAVWRCDVNHGDEERRNLYKQRSVPATKSYRLAARAAALGLFSGRSMLSLKPGRSEPGVVTADEFLAGVEPMQDGTLLQPEADDLADLQRLAVFESVLGGKRLVFTHQLMREFLAASWLAERKVPLTQLIPLLGCWREDGAWRHYPQTVAVAAWLASHPRQKEWRKFLIGNDPAVLLRADAAGLCDDEKREIAKALLDCARRDGAVDRSWRHRHLSGLACDGLADILRPYLLDTSVSGDAARDLAIDIVDEARVQDSADDLWALIRQPGIKCREEMAHALLCIAGDRYDSLWQEILDGQIQPDERQTLLGAAVLALFPRKLTVREVLPYFIPTRDFLHADQIYWKAYDEVMKHASPDDALHIVRLSIRNRASGFRDSMGEGADSLLRKALLWLSTNWGRKDHIEAFVEWWWAAVRTSRLCPDWKDYNQAPVSLDELGFDVAEHRRAVLESAVTHPALQFGRKDEHFGNWYETFVRLPEDIPWLIERLHAAEPTEARIYAHWLRWAFNRHRNAPGIHSLLEEAYVNSPALRAVLPTPAEGKNIMQEFDARDALAQEKSRQRGVLFATRESEWTRQQKAAVDSWLQQARSRFEKHDHRAWHSLENVFFSEKHRASGPLELQTIDAIFTKNEEWMFEAAKRWLLHPAPAYPILEEQKMLYFQPLAVWALYALWERLDDETISGVKNGWLPHVFANMLRLGWGNDTFNFANVLKRFLPESIDAVVDVIRAEYLSGSDSWAVRQLKSVEEAALPQIKQLLLEIPPQPQGFHNLFGWLASIDFDAALEVASHWMARVPEERFEQTDVALFAGVLSHLKGRLWPELRPRVWGDREKAVAVINHAFRRISLNPEQHVSASEWPPEFLSDMAELLLVTYPPEEREYEGGFFESHAILRVRDQLVAELASRGMTDAIGRLESLRIEHTQRCLRQVKLRAFGSDMASRWQPVQPSDLLAVAGGHDFRLVKTNDDLLRAVGAALEEYERELQQSSGTDLLNQDSSPKLEESLSDHLARWLENRHQIFRIRENQTPKGQREDITVCFNQPGKQPLSLCIEVKKDKSDELMQKMETQLLKQYLTDQQNRTHGLFVVFWFQDKEQLTLPKVVEQLMQQAESLSTGPYRLASKVIDCRSLPVPKPKARSAKKKTKSNPALRKKKTRTVSGPRL